MLIFPDTSTALEQAVGVASTAFGAMASGETWQLTTDTALFFAQGAAPTATAGAGSTELPAGASALLHGANGAKVAVIQDTAAGKVTLTRVILY